MPVLPSFTQCVERPPLRPSVLDNEANGALESPFAAKPLRCWIDRSTMLLDAEPAETSKL